MTEKAVAAKLRVFFGASALVLGLACASAYADTIVVPSGLDATRLDLVSRGETMKVSVALFAHDASDNPLPPEWLAVVGSKEQLTERFIKKVQKSARFKIFDSRYAIEKADIDVTGQFAETTQHVVPSGSGFKALTTVGLNLSVVDALAGGRGNDQCEIRYAHGDQPGVGARAVGKADIGSDAFKLAAQADRSEAVEQALDQAAYCLIAEIRPLGKVLKADGEIVDLFGGSAHGLEPQDKLVVFEASTAKLGERQLVTTRAVAEIQCASVGKETSQCRVLRKANRDAKITDAHFAILSDESLNKRFE
jgi:hypothetical protein